MRLKDTKLKGQHMVLMNPVASVKFHLGECDNWIHGPVVGSTFIDSGDKHGKPALGWRNKSYHHMWSSSSWPKYEPLSKEGEMSNTNRVHAHISTLTLQMAIECAAAPGRSRNTNFPIVYCPLDVVWYPWTAVDKNDMGCNFRPAYIHNEHIQCPLDQNIYV